MLDTQSISDAETEEKIGESPQRTLPRRLLLGALTVLFLASLALLIGFGLGKYREHTAVASQRLQVTVLNVGHGEATWIQTPGGKFILVGSGPPEAGELVVASLRRAGAQQIDLLVLPYPYAESIGGVASVLKAFPIIQAVEPGGPRINQVHEDVRRLLSANKIPIRIARDGDRFDVDGAVVRVLAPSEPLIQTTPEAANNSLVLRIGWGGTGFLFAGGLERAGEDVLVARSDDLLPSDWLRVSRFGTREATSPEFLRLVSPDFAVISVGATNSGGYPHEETLQHLTSSGARVFRTDQYPKVEMTFFSDGTTVFPLQEQN